MTGSTSSGRWLIPDSGPLIRLRISVSRQLWRLGPAWAVLGGALACNMPWASGEALLRLAGAIWLADSAWGAIWVVMACGSPEGPDLARTHPLVPYATSEAPLSTLLYRLVRLASGATWNELVAGLGTTALLALLLGGQALILSLGVVAVAFWAQYVAQRGFTPAMCQALLSVGLPWLLGMTLGNQLGAEAMTSGHQAAAALLGSSLVLLEWGTRRATGSLAGRSGGIWMGQAAVVLVLLGLRIPWAAGVTTALFLPPSLWLAKGAETRKDKDRSVLMPSAVQRSSPWWWLALAFSALALRTLPI